MGWVPNRADSTIVYVSWSRENLISRSVKFPKEE